MQIQKIIELFDEEKIIRPGVIIGGMSKEKQERICSRKSRIIIATPGRLLDILSSGEIQRLKYLTMV